MLSPRGARGVERLNSTGTLIQTTTTEAPQRTYVLHRTGCTQEEHQLLREGRERSNSSARQSGGNTLGTRYMDEDSSAAVDCGHGSDHLHRLELRLLETARSRGKGGAPAHATRDRRIQEEERPDRCQQDC